MPFALSAGFGFTESKLKFFTNNLTELTDSGYRTHCDLQFILRGSTQNVFAYSDDDYYIVGGNSSITHWDGSAFTLEETGTSWETKDLYGNTYDLWAVAGTPSAYKGGVLYKPRGGNWSPVDSLSDGYKRSVNSVWCDSRPYDRDGFVILAGRGIWYRDTTWRRPPSAMTQGGLGLGNLYFKAVRGRARSDVFAVGDFDIILHYNGSSWHFYKEFFSYPNGGSLVAVAVVGKDVFIAGDYNDGKGRIYHGRRK